MFRGYRFEHPKKEISITVGGWSYLWAGLLGAAYLWWMGHPKLVPKAAALNIGYLVFYIAVWAATSIRFVPIRYQAIILVVLIPILIISQGTAMLRMLRDAYRRRGWLVRQG